MVQSYDLPDDAAYHAFHRNIDADASRNNVVSGGNVTTGSIDLSVDVTASTTHVDGDLVETPAGTDISLPAASSDPRKDVIWVSHDSDGTGTIQVTSGDPEAVSAPDGVNPVGENTWAPSPPGFKSTNGTALAEVWVPGGSPTNADLIIYDRRVTARAGYGRVRAGEAQADMISGDVTNGQQLTDFEGDDISIVNGSLSFTGTTSGGGTGGTSDNAVEIVHAVDDLGADPTGSGDVGQIIHDNQAPGRVIYFPEGTYRVASTPSIQDSQCVETDSNGNVIENRFILRGPNARFFGADVTEFTDATGSGYPDSAFLRGNRFNEHVRLVLDSITWDFTAAHAGHGLVSTKLGSLVVKDVHVVGEWKREDHRRNVLNVEVVDGTETTQIHGLRAMEGSIHQPVDDGYGAEHPDAYHAQPAGIYLSQMCNPDATIHIEDCAIRGWPNNGIYGSSCPSAVQVENCYFANNGHANVRLGGNRSYIKGTRIEVNSNVDSSFSTCRGVWWREESDSDGSDGIGAPDSEEETASRIENCHITIYDVSGPTPTAIQVDATMGAGTVADTVIVSSLNDSSTDAVTIQPYDTRGGGDQTPEDHTTIRFENCHIRRNGRGSGATAVTSGRERAVFIDCSIRAVQSGDTGIDITNTGNRNRVEYCEFRGAGTALQWDGADGVLKYNQADSNAPTVNGSQPRLVTNQWSDNNGVNPRNGGPWNGNERTGVFVSWYNSGSGRNVAIWGGSQWFDWGTSA